jgi:ketosteroid isomerase-like protein
VNQKSFLKARHPKSIFLPIIFIFLIIIAIVYIACNNNKVTDTKSVADDEQVQIEEIKKMESERSDAGVTKDFNVFNSATADDYMQIDFDGIVLDKTATLERIKSSYAQLHSNVLDDMIVRIYGNTALVNARANPKGIMKGKEFSDAIRYTRVYVKRDGHWQVVLFQQTRIVPDK